MNNIFNKIVTSLLLIVGIHKTAPVVPPTPQHTPVAIQQQATIVTAPVAVAPATVAQPKLSTSVKATKKIETDTSAPVVQPVQVQTPTPPVATPTTPALTQQQIANNAIMAAEAATAQAQRDAQAAALLAQQQATANAAAAATLQYQQQQAYANTTQGKLDAINKQIADLNSKYASDKIAMENQPGAETEDQMQGQLNDLYNTYRDNYNVLEAQYQEIEAGN